MNNGFNRLSRFLFYEGVQTDYSQGDADSYYLRSWSTSIRYLHSFIAGINNGTTTTTRSTVWNKWNDPSRDNADPTINGSVSIADNIVNFPKENTKIPFVGAAETAQQQITNGTILEGHLGVTQGYLAYTYLVANQSDKTIHKVIIDAGNGQVLSTSEGISWESFDQSRHAEFGHWKGHHSFFGGPWNSLPFGSAPWTSFGSNSNNDRGIGSW